MDYRCFPGGFVGFRVFVACKSSLQSSRESESKRGGFLFFIF